MSRLVWILRICEIFIEHLAMKNFNLYINGLDYSQIKKLFEEKGTIQTFKRKEYFVEQNAPSLCAGWIEKGDFRYTCFGEDGREHIVGFSFTGEFVCDYSSFMKQDLALVSIQAINDCLVHTLSYNDIISFWETNSDRQRFGRQMSEEMFSDIYKRLLGFYCSTPEQRYSELMQRCPNLKEKISLREIASFLGATPETVSHIRKRLQSE